MRISGTACTDRQRAGSPVHDWPARGIGVQPACRLSHRRVPLVMRGRGRGASGGEGSLTRRRRSAGGSSRRQRGSPWGAPCGLLRMGIEGTDSRCSASRRRVPFALDAGGSTGTESSGVSAAQHGRDLTARRRAFCGAEVRGCGSRRLRRASRPRGTGARRISETSYNIGQRACQCSPAQDRGDREVGVLSARRVSVSRAVMDEPRADGCRSHCALARRLAQSQPGTEINPPRRHQDGWRR